MNKIIKFILSLFKSETETPKEMQETVASEPRRKSIKQLDLDGNLITIWKSGNEAANQLKIGRKYILLCCKGEKKSYKGFKWEFYV